ncbi:RDD family protein [Flavobacterium reichenbachii]|uniref:Transporter n=1 Tax=Flavobacterium reichenbachii TaxID=362418 RepID=A0A085ZRB7_9FLAO|nr:RDD family protein [Flavobacterium reichenbachii]KFF06981.1 transporter [Flavobacterium reichenbachii]OXB12045.1 transporter [Flavobacterium reichenbachii]
MSNSTYILDETLLASNGQRFLNYILDTIIIIALVFLLSILLALAAILLGFKGVLIWMGNVGNLEERLIFVVIAIFYYAFAEGLFSRSLGKLITGTIVVDENGKKPSFGTIFKRSLCRAIPFDALSFLGSSGIGWHDSISDTYVVNKKALDEEVKNFYEFNLIGVQETE